MAMLVGGMKGPIVGPGYYAGYRQQRGGGFWSKALSAAIIPALKFIGKKAAGVGADVLSDVSEGQNVQEALKSRVKEEGKKLVSSAADRALKFAQTGKGKRVKKLGGGRKKIVGGRKHRGGKLKGGKKGKMRGGKMKGGKRRMKGGKRRMKGGNKFKRITGGKMKGGMKTAKKLTKNKSRSIPNFLK